MSGGFTNFTHVIEAVTAKGNLFRIVVRRYSNLYQDPIEKARVEFQALILLSANDIPAPTALYVDETGAVLGAPGIVMSFIEGRQVVAPTSEKRWATNLAEVMARIHSIDLDQTERASLFDADSIVAYYLETDQLPEKLALHPDGAEVWDTYLALRESAAQVSLALLHTHFWMGNVLWQEGSISGVIDWETASYGDPSLDVAYCRMDMQVTGFERAADYFLEAYEAFTDKPVENLELWELVAAAGVMPDPAIWLPFWQELGNDWSTPDTVRSNLRRFVADALRKSAHSDLIRGK
jgi:aminoglycoside phosphotransferase (APT) family kinase protein